MSGDFGPCSLGEFISRVKCCNDAVMFDRISWDETRFIEKRLPAGASQFSPKWIIDHNQEKPYGIYFEEDVNEEIMNNLYNSVCEGLELIYRDRAARMK